MLLYKVSSWSFQIFISKPCVILVPLQKYLLVFVRKTPLKHIQAWSYVTRSNISNVILLQGNISRTLGMDVDFTIKP